MSDLYFTRETIPDIGFKSFRKVRITMAVRIQGTFHCLTSEGNIASCTDGWLAIDSQGFPYPINSPEFQATYKLVEDAEVAPDGVEIA